MDEYVKIRTMTVNEYERGNIAVLNNSLCDANVTDLALLTGLYAVAFGYENDNGLIDESYIRYGSFHLSFDNEKDYYNEDGKTIRKNGFFPCAIMNDNKLKFNGKRQAFYYESQSIHPRAGVRPVLEVSYPDFFERFTDNLNITQIGEYPQYVVEPILSGKLNDMLAVGRLEKTGKKYTFANNTFYNFNDKWNADFEPLVYVEYKYDNRKFIKVKQQNKTTRFVDRLVNKGYYHDAWVEVTPVDWIVDKKNHLLISKNVLVSGLSGSAVRIYLNEYMLDELGVISSLERNFVLLKNLEDSFDQNKTGQNFNNDEKKEKIVDLLRFLVESGIELSEKQRSILEFYDNKELREKRQSDIRQKILLENEKKAEWLNSSENPSNIRKVQFIKLREQVDMLKKLEKKMPGILSLEQQKMIEYVAMVDLADSLPREVDAGMNGEIRDWYLNEYKEYNDDIKKRS